MGVWNGSDTHGDPGISGVTVTHVDCDHRCCSWKRFSLLLPLSLPRSIFPSPEQNPGLCHYQGLLNTGGSLPDLSNLHFPSPLSTPLDPEDNGAYPNLSGGSSTGNLPAAMMHLGIGNSQGGQGTALRLVFHIHIWVLYSIFWCCWHWNDQRIFARTQETCLLAPQHRRWAALDRKTQTTRLL